MITISLLQEFIGHTQHKVEKFYIMSNGNIGLICDRFTLVIPINPQDFNHWLANRREQIINDVIQ